jgi:hypothetical protein
MMSVAAVIMAPVLPAEKKPCARPSRTRRQPTTIEESVWARTAAAGCSSIAMVSDATTASTRSRELAYGVTTSVGPTSRTWRE